MTITTYLNSVYNLIINVLSGSILTPLIFLGGALMMIFLVVWLAQFFSNSISRRD